MKRVGRRKSSRKRRSSSRRRLQPKIYYIHDNGGRPFQIEICGKSVKVYKVSDRNRDPILTFRPQKIFIGKSIEHGRDFDGNTILLQFANNRYVFIGPSIFSFRTYAPIVEYISPVGNSDVPYPYAVDTFGNCYLLTEDVMVKNVPSNTDPYNYYYRENLILSHKNPDEKFFVGPEAYNLLYNPRPKREFQRFVGFQEGPIAVEQNGNRRLVSQRKFVDVLEKFGRRKGFEPLMSVRVLQERLP